MATRMLNGGSMMHKCKEVATNSLWRCKHDPIRVPFEDLSAFVNNGTSTLITKQCMFKCYDRKYTSIVRVHAYPT